MTDRGKNGRQERARVARLVREAFAEIDRVQALQGGLRVTLAQIAGWRMLPVGTWTLLGAARSDAQRVVRPIWWLGSRSAHTGGQTHLTPEGKNTLCGLTVPPHGIDGDTGHRCQSCTKLAAQYNATVQGGRRQQARADRDMEPFRAAVRRLEKTIGCQRKPR